VSAAAPTAAAAGAGRHPGTYRTALAGTVTLLRFAARRDRVRLPVWIGALAVGTWSSVGSFTSQYPTAEDRATLAETLSGPAGLAMSGPEHYLGGGYGYGAMAGHQLLGFFGILIGLMSVLTVVRHTRAEEETGRAELLRANVVGRHAHLAAALALTVAANLLLGALLAAGLAGLGADGVTAGGSLLYGAACAAMGVTFAAVAAVAVQITPFARGASGLGLAAVGVAYALRVVGDVGAGALSWLSPIGWAQRTYVYVDDRWWPLLLHAALAAGCGAAAVALGRHRDVGAGLRPPRPGRREASGALVRPLGFALRLQRGVLAGFLAGGLLFGLMYGSILGDAEDLLAENDALRQAVERVGGGSPAESFASVAMSVLAIVAACHVVLACQRPRAEETAGRAEPVLATGLSRTRWLASHLVTAVAGGTAVMLAAGLGFGVSGGLSADDTGLGWRIAAASAAYAPALWLTAGVAVALFGWFPRATAAAWLVPAYAFVVVYLGELMDLPEGPADLSPIGRVPRVPAADLAWTPLLVMTVLAAALAALGLAGFRRRDVDGR
jgi:ABC-2 type transport system permease protein